MNERRKSRRVPTNFVVIYVVTGIKYSHQYEVIRSVDSPQTVDLSIKGLKIFNKEELKKSTKLKILMSFQDSKDILIAIGKVIWSKFLPESSSFQTGIKFIKFLTKNKNKLNDFVNKKIE